MSNSRAFLLTYLHRELRRRRGQAMIIAAGLAVGIGLVLSIAAASRGVRDAQARTLHSLYGIGTDLTVTTPAAHARRSGATAALSGRTAVLSIGEHGLLSAASATDVSRLAGVVEAAGALTLTDTSLAPGGGPPVTFTISGLDLAHLRPGPFSAARLESGRMLQPTDGRARVAILDAGYARSHRLFVGSLVTIAGVRFAVIGIVTQPPGSGAADVYIPLARAQELTGPSNTRSAAGKIDVIYVHARSAALIPDVQREISRLLPSATVTTASNIASMIRGSLADVAHLANDLGRWLSIAALLTAFAAAALLMTGAVGRRVRELGTLKALGWGTRRIVAQIIAESLVTGVIGATAGAGVGLTGSAVIDAIGPTLTAVGQGGAAEGSVAAHLSARLTAVDLLLGVLLALAGSLIAGGLGAWRASRMRPADAFAHQP